MNKKITRQRYVVAWLFIIVAVIAGYMALLYNTNTILMAFGKGKVQLNDFNSVISFVQDSYEEYTILQKTQNIKGEDYLAYSTVDNFAKIVVTGQENEIILIAGEIDIAELNVLQITQIKKTIDRVLEPLVEKGYVLPLEVAILKESLLSIRIADHYNLDIIIDEKEFVLEKEKNSTLFTFTLIPLDN